MSAPSPRGVGAALAALMALAPMALALVVPSVDAQPRCVASAAGTFSHDVRVSPRAGGQCLYVVTVFDGATCEADRRRWSAELACSEARRVRVTDRGRLVSILAPRASNRLWPIVRIFTQDGPDFRRTSLRLHDLPGAEALHGTLRMSFDGASLVMTSRDASGTIALDVLEMMTPE